MVLSFYHKVPLIEKNLKNPLNDHNWFTRTVYYYFIVCFLFVSFWLSLLFLIHCIPFVNSEHIKCFIFLCVFSSIQSTTVTQLIFSFCTHSFMRAILQNGLLHQTEYLHVQQQQLLHVVLLHSLYGRRHFNRSSLNGLLKHIYNKHTHIDSAHQPLRIALNISNYPNWILTIVCHLIDFVYFVRIQSRIIFFKLM